MLQVAVKLGSILLVYCSISAFNAAHALECLGYARCAHCGYCLRLESCCCSYSTYSQYFWRSVRLIFPVLAIARPSVLAITIFQVLTDFDICLAHLRIVGPCQFLSGAIMPMIEAYDGEYLRSISHIVRQHTIYLYTYS